MNKFTITSHIPETDKQKPVLYKVFFSNKYWLHKGKELQQSLDRFLDDIDRGIRGLNFPPCYTEVVNYCKKHPGIHKVSVSLVLNDESPKILKREAAILKAMSKDTDALYDPSKPPYTPEWMLKEKFAERCDDDKCVKSGTISGKKASFRFCPNCGRLNK